MSDLNKLLDKWNQEMQREFSPDPQTLIRLGDQILLGGRIISALQAQNADLLTRVRELEQVLKCIGKLPAECGISPTEAANRMSSLALAALVKDGADGE